TGWPSRPYMTGINDRGTGQCGMKSGIEKGATSMDHHAEYRGLVALAGSGEYTPAMDAADRALLDAVGGPTRARVALVSTASGREPGRPQYWNELGLHHYKRLGVSDIRPVGIIDAEGAGDPAWCAMLRDANFFYFSGGDPLHLIASLRGSPAWELIH